MNFAATAENRITYILNDARQSIGANMGMGIGENCSLCTVLTEDIEDLLYTTTFLGTGIEFAVGICPCTALAKTIVALGIHEMFTRNTSNVFLAVVDILATFDHNGSQSQFYQAQSSKESTGSCTNDNDLLPVFDIWIINTLEGLFTHRLIHPATNGQIYHDLTLTSINASTNDTHALNLVGIKPRLASCRLFIFRLGGRHLRHHP